MRSETGEIGFNAIIELYNTLNNAFFSHTLNCKGSANKQEQKQATKRTKKKRRIETRSSVTIRFIHILMWYNPVIGSRFFFLSHSLSMPIILSIARPQRHNASFLMSTKSDVLHYWQRCNRLILICLLYRRNDKITSNAAALSDSSTIFFSFHFWWPMNETCGTWK